MLSIEALALSAALDCATVDHCDSENSQTPELRLDATATMPETRVLEQCEPIELALGLLSAPSRPEEALSEPNWADATLDWALYEPHWSPGASSATMASGPALSGAFYFQV